MELIDLKKIGLTEGEIKVYDALLELGECTKTSLAKKSGVAPSNIYDITNRLLQKGIISKVEKNGISHFNPANPREILMYLEQKGHDIEKEKDYVNQILPTLLLKYSEKKESSSVEVFNGWNGLKTIFDDLLEECNKGDRNYVLGASQGENSAQVDTFFLKYSQMRDRKGIKTSIIFNEGLRKRKDRMTYFMKSANYDVRFLDKSTPAEIMIYKDRTIIIILTAMPLAIRITGSEVENSFMQYFQLMWSIAKK